MISIDIIRDVFKYKSQGYSNKTTAKLVGLSDSSVDRFVLKQKDSGLTFEQLSQLRDIELELIVWKRPLSNNFIQPNYEEVKKFLSLPGSYDSKKSLKPRVTLATAWKEKYLIPNLGENALSNGEVTYSKLPQNIMSFSTFRRGYRNYLKSHGIVEDNSDKYSTFAYLNDCGPAGQIMIDGVGDKLIWKDPNNEEHVSRVLVGVLVYSGYIFVLAVKDFTSVSWLKFIQAMFNHIGGCTYSIKSDNDAGLTTIAFSSRGVNGRVYHTKQHNEKVRLIEDYYDVEFILGKKHTPRAKAMVERAVLTVEQLMEKLSPSGTTPLALDLDDLNKQLAQLVNEYNAKPISGQQLSRLYYFNKEEKPYLKPLPNDKVNFESATKATVSIRGYIRYQYNDYYVGVERCSQNILCLINQDGKLELRDFKTLEIIVTYKLPTQQEPRIMRYKDPKFYSNDEKYMTRNLKDFLKLSEEFVVFSEQLKAVMRKIWEKVNTPNLDKTQESNQLLEFCSKYETYGSQLKEMLLKILSISKFSFIGLRDCCIETEKQILKQSAETLDFSKLNKNIRGANYYEDVLNSNKEGN